MSDAVPVLSPKQGQVNGRTTDDATVLRLVLTAGEVMERVRAVVERDGRLGVIGVAGPGDPLANPETLQVLGMVDAEFPEVTLCLSTNGLMLPEVIDDLKRLHRLTLTVTVNAVQPQTASKIYRDIAEAASLADTVIICSAGRVIRQATPGEVLTFRIGAGAERRKPETSPQPRGAYGISLPLDRA